MLNLNYESIFTELRSMESQLEVATPDSCVKMIELLSSSLIKIVDIKKKPDDVLDEEWDNYCRRSYELASFMYRLIQNYNSRFNAFVLPKLNKLNPELTYSNSTSDADSSATMVNRTNSSKISPMHQQSISQSIKKQKTLNKGKGADDSSISDKSNIVSIRKGSTLRKSTNIDGTEINYDDDESKYVQSNIYSEDESSSNKERPESPLTPNSDLSLSSSRVNSFNNINKMNSVHSSPSYTNRNNHVNNSRLSLPNPSIHRNSLDSMNNNIINEGLMSSNPSNVVTTTASINNSYMNQMQNQTNNSSNNSSNSSINNNNNYYMMNQNQQLQNQQFQNQQFQNQQFQNQQFQNQQFQNQQFQNQNFMNINQNYMDPNQFQNQNFMDPNQLQNLNFMNQNYMNQNVNYYMNSNGDLQFDPNQQQNFLQERFNILSGTFDNNNLNNGDMNLQAMYNHIPAIDDGEQYQSSEGTTEEVTEAGKDNFIGNYICIKNYEAEMDAYIDLEAGDIVSISEFSGEYALGFNCRTERYGLFPIYDIDSLNGFAIFYRVIADNEPDCSKNDAIFVVSEVDNDLLHGYNITKGDTGLFTMEQLEVLQFDSDNNPILDENLLNNQQIDQPINMVSTDPMLMAYDVNAQTMAGQPGYPYNVYPNTSYETLNLNYYNNDGLINYPVTEDNRLHNKQNSVSECANMLNDLVINDTTGQNVTPSKKIRVKKVQVTNHQKIKYTIQHYIEKETEFNDKMKATINILKANLEKYVDTNEEILNKVEIGILFKYFPNLYSFSNELLRNLEDCLSKYDTAGLNTICTFFDKDTFNCSAFVKYCENYENSLDAFDRIRKDINKFDKVERILKTHKDAFHKQEFKDLLLTPINHFVTYKLILNDIKKEVCEDDIYDKLDEEIEYIKKIGDQMNIKVGESIKIRKFFALKKIVMGFPDDFISSTRKLITDFEIMGNVRGTFKKHVYLFNDCVVVVSTNKDARKKGFEYVLENIIYYKDYDFEKVEQGNKICIKCVCKNKDLINGQYDSRFKNKRNGGLFKTSKGKKGTYDEDNSMYLYFNDINSYNVFFEECKVQKSNLEGASSSR